MTVHFSSHFVSYLQNVREVEITAKNLGELLTKLDEKFPGLRFRILDEAHQVRKHIRIFINHEIAEGLDQNLAAQDDVHILGALSGG